MTSFCSRCGAAAKGAAFCSQCGNDLREPHTASLLEPRPQTEYLNENLAASKHVGSGLSSAAIGLGISAFWFFPIIFGPVAITLAAMAKSKGESRADVALAVAIGGTVLGMLIGAAFWSRF